MDVDASQYASISREILERGDWLHITNRHLDYLDKPPLLFWLSALSFKIFGISNFAYKLPSLLFALLGIFSTYKLGKLLYSEKTGLLAALVFASCQAMFLMTNDVRTDTILTGVIIFSIWNIAAYDKSGKWISLIAGFTGIALAMLAKGPIGIMAPALAFGSHFILKREWKNIFRWQWIAGLLIVAVLLTPMLIGLYQQFDAHPEKGVSGVRFFLWDQSFGRLTGDNPFVNAQQTKQPFSPLFFTHTFLWSFLPWSVLFLFAYWEKLKHIFTSKFRLKENEEAISLGGFTLVFIAMSLSEYKLPHYIFIVFPLAAIICADYVIIIFEKVEKKKLQRFFSAVQITITSLVWLIILVICIYCFPMKNTVPVGRHVFLWLICALLFALWIYYLLRSDQFQKTILISLTAFIGANFLFSTHFYPTLLSYQSPAQAGKFITENNIPEEHFFCYNVGGHSIDFYSQRTVPWVPIQVIAERKNIWVYTNDVGKNEIEISGLKPDSIIEYSDYKVTSLSLPFVLPDKRENVLKKRYLLYFGED